MCNEFEITNYEDLVNLTNKLIILGHSTISTGLLLKYSKYNNGNHLVRSIRNVCSTKDLNQVV